MPRKAPLFPRVYQPSAPPIPKVLPMPGQGPSLPQADVQTLWNLHRRGVEYFLDNQTPGGLMLDRQANHGLRRPHGLVSTSATGMGLIALALGTAPPHRMLSPGEACRRIGTALRSALHDLPHEEGVLPHFLDSATGQVRGFDLSSTIDTAWLVAGGLWAAAFLDDGDLVELADRLFQRVHWHYWTVPSTEGPGGLLRHGKGANGRFLGCAWDRLNAETAFMYVLGAGAAEGRALCRDCWQALRPYYGTVAGLRFNNADLGLFVFQYSLELLNLEAWGTPGPVDLWQEAKVAALANRQACRLAAGQFTTYRRFWGMSAGDGPGEVHEPDTYRCYAPSGPVDGTAHLTATMASMAHVPEAVLENVHEADRHPGLMGRYGFSNVNLDRGWVGRDMVGIDAGAAVLALDNYLTGGRVRDVFHRLPCVRQGLERLGFVQETEQTPRIRRAS